MPDRYLLLCAGNGSRWSRHGGVPKQLVKVWGEPVLHRTARLILDRDPEADIRIVVKDSRDDTWRIPGTKRAQAHLDDQRAQADKLLSSRHLWSRTARTIVLFGDVVFTDWAMDRIVANPDPWTAFARFGASEFTGCDHRELFGFAFDPSEHDRLEEAAERCLRIHRDGRMGGWSGGWQIYAAAAGADDEGVASRFRDRGNIVEIDDWTDDFDHPKDWDRFCWRWAKATPERRTAGHGPQKGANDG